MLKFDIGNILSNKAGQVNVKFKYFDIKAGENREITKKLPLLVNQKVPGVF